MNWLPNALTIARILAAVIAAICVLAGQPGVALAAFLFAALSDFLDGWAARALDAASAFGAWLDPIADKLLVALVLSAMALSGGGWMLIAPGAAIILRDGLVSWWRMRLGGGHALPVLVLAKWKTALEMVAIGLLLLVPLAGEGSGRLIWLVGIVSLWLAAAASVWTGARYGRAARKAIAARRA